MTVLLRYIATSLPNEQVNQTQSVKINQEEESSKVTTFTTLKMTLQKSIQHTVLNCTRDIPEERHVRRSDGSQSNFYDILVHCSKRKVHNKNLITVFTNARNVT